MRIIGSSMVPLFVPATLSVCCSIFYLTSSKSVNLVFEINSNSTHGVASYSEMCIKRSSNGLRVYTPFQ